MPTGYTANIANGITFEQFVMDCARAFGACITLRDEAAGGDKIPNEFKADPYHMEQRDLAHRRLYELEAMSDVECDIAARAEWEKEEESRKQQIKKQLELKAKYEAMLAQVDNWIPPTLDHNELKQFMRKQIVDSINFDISLSYYQVPIRLKTGTEWRALKQQTYQQNIKYHTEQYAKEVATAAKRTAWITALRDSIAG